MSTVYYAISNRKDTREIVCTFHLPTALDELPEWDAYRLDHTLLNDGETAHCERCDA